ncbi:hypothetical protein N9W21_04105 [Shewanella sp.]|nr:hypothetical protein [Shewanella sp.]
MHINSNQLNLQRIEVNPPPELANTVIASTTVAEPVVHPYEDVFVDHREGSTMLSSRLGAHLEYETSTGGHRGAIAEYLTNQHAAKREVIQQMVGIDTYA